MVVKPVVFDGDGFHDDHLHFFNPNNLLLFNNALDEIFEQAALSFCPAKLE